ncbi:MAG: ParB/RepB/Spo0J family partition protein [Ignavibacteriales bacterium]|nr:ParB/RepB/Spo0J family partition protein [Ignavibacteriales bacterium]
MSKQKGGLGRGLSALIRPTAQETTPTSSAKFVETAAPNKPLSHIEVAKIRPNPFQPRADFDPQALDELKESIKQKGIIQAVTVRLAKDGMYELISGERRIRAATDIGMKTVPAYIIEVKLDEEMLELALIENLQREHLNSIEIAISYQRLMNDIGLTAEDIAKKVSKDRTTVVNFLRLLKLPKIIQDALRKDKLTMGHARALISLPDEQTQLRIFDKILKKDLNVRQVEKLVREAGKKNGKKSSRNLRSPGTVEDNLAERLQQILGTKVRVNSQEAGRGEIIIEFYNSDDLGRLFDLLSSIES